MTASRPPPLFRFRLQLQVTTSGHNSSLPQMLQGRTGQQENKVPQLTKKEEKGRDLGALVWYAFHAKYLLAEKTCKNCETKANIDSTVYVGLVLTLSYVFSADHPEFARWSTDAVCISLMSSSCPNLLQEEHS